jgi:hypothetical protein
MSGTIIKIEYIRRIPCQATLQPGGRLTTGWPTIHPKAGPDAGLVAEPQSGLAVARPFEVKGKISVDTAPDHFIIILIR